MAKSNKVMIQVCLCGAGTKKAQAPTVPYTAEELAEQVIAVAKAGASVVHIHVREDKEVNGVMEIGYKSMGLKPFTDAVEACREACKAAGVDVIINLTTSGGEYEDYKRLQHLSALKPEMCSYDPGSLNWGNSYIFKNEPSLLEHLGTLCQELNCKPECEIFDGGFCTNIAYYLKKGILTNPVHCQLVLGVAGGMPGTVESVSYLTRHLPEGCTWSITGIGHAHMACMLAGLAADCDGLRVGLEDNIYMEKGVLATNVQLVERAIRLGKEAGREIATPEDTRQILGLKGKMGD